MITYEITIVCDGCKATFSTGENQRSHWTDVAIGAAWEQGWRFPRLLDADAPNYHFCPICVQKNERMLGVTPSLTASKKNSADPSAQGQPG